MAEEAGPSGIRVRRRVTTESEHHEFFVNPDVEEAPEVIAARKSTWDKIFSFLTPKTVKRFNKRFKQETGKSPPPVAVAQALASAAHLAPAPTVPISSARSYHTLWEQLERIRVETRIDWRPLFSGLLVGGSFQPLPVEESPVKASKQCYFPAQKATSSSGGKVRTASYVQWGVPTILRDAGAELGIDLPKKVTAGPMIQLLAGNLPTEAMRDATVMFENSHICPFPTCARHIKWEQRAMQQGRSAQGHVITSPSLCSHVPKCLNPSSLSNEDVFIDYSIELVREKMAYLPTTALKSGGKGAKKAVARWDQIQPRMQRTAFAWDDLPTQRPLAESFAAGDKTLRAALASLQVAYPSPPQAP
jgi:hypothetical protein